MEKQSTHIKDLIVTYFSGSLDAAELQELQNWISYFDKFWATKLKKLETLLNNKLSN